MPITDTLASQLDRLAAFEPGPFPVLSLYLNLQPDSRGRDNFEPFLRKELTDRIKTYGTDGPEGGSLEKDAEKIRSYVDGVDRAANGIAIFACSASNLFETVVLSAPIHENLLYISDQPHLYPLARVLDEHPRYAVLLADTHSSRIIVIAAHQIEQTEQIQGTKTRRHKMGGWSQARYQRHIENYHLQHAKEVADTLARLVRDEHIGSILVSGDDVVVPLLREQFPKEVADRVVDTVKLDARATERDILEAAEALVREKDAESDRERVDALLGAYRANGLATVGVENTRAALELGQVDELVIAAVPEAIDAAAVNDGDDSARQVAEPTAEERTADELIAGARQTAASIRFIEDKSLLAPFGGVGAFLRFKL
jgi:peptide chain release factor subunit 1